MRVVIEWSAGALIGVVALIVFSGSAMADQPAPAGAPSQCPESISDPYPFLACRTSGVRTVVIAGPTGDDTWENSRATPGTHPFVNGGGFFGEALNGWD